jgi:hypothetical protein
MKVDLSKVAIIEGVKNMQNQAIQVKGGAA